MGGMCGVQFALSQSPGLEVMMLFPNNDAGVANNRQGLLHVSRIENKQTNKIIRAC